jgi:fimbrial isopeptide formation D2 family protein
MLKLDDLGSFRFQRGFASQGERMNIGKGLRGIAAAALSATTIMACGVIGIGSASASPVDVSSNDGEITIHSAGAGHVYKALKIGDYTSANVEEVSGTPKIATIQTSTVDSPATLKQAIANAANNAGATVPTSGECASDPVCWISSHWLGYGQDDRSSAAKKEGYKGHLRDFVTNLQGEPGFNDTVNASGISKTAVEANGDASVSFTGLSQGLYVIEDVSGAGVDSNANSIPVLVGTSVGPNRCKVFMNAATPNAGEVEAKKETPSVEKRLDFIKDEEGKEVDRSQSGPVDGDVMHFKLTTKVPMTTGFNRYFFRVTDTASSGIEYVSNSAKVTVGNAGKNVVDVPTASTSPVDEVYLEEMTSNSDGMRHLNFTFPNVMQYQQHDNIVIEYDAKATQTGRQNNTAGVDWSSDVNHQPNGNCVADPAASDCGVTKHSDTSNYSFATYNMVLKNFDGDLQNVQLGGAKFQLLKDGKPLEFRKLGDGSYVYHPDKAHSGLTTEMTVSERKPVVQGARAISFFQPRVQLAADSDEGLGNLKIDGLPFGIYTVSEVAPPTSKPNAELLKFDVKFTEDVSNHGVYVSLLKDYTQGLVQQPVQNKDHLGATFSLNVSKQPSGLLGAIGSVSNGILGPGTLARTGVSLFILLILLCCLMAIATTIMKRRHQISR